MPARTPQPRQGSGKTKRIGISSRSLSSRRRSSAAEIDFELLTGAAGDFEEQVIAGRGANRYLEGAVGGDRDDRDARAEGGVPDFDRNGPRTGQGAGRSADDDRVVFFRDADPRAIGAKHARLASR